MTHNLRVLVHPNPFQSPSPSTNEVQPFTSHSLRFTLPAMPYHNLPVLTMTHPSLPRATSLARPSPSTPRHTESEQSIPALPDRTHPLLTTTHQTCLSAPILATPRRTASCLPFRTHAQKCSPVPTSPYATTLSLPRLSFAVRSTPKHSCRTTPCRTTPSQAMPILPRLAPVLFLASPLPKRQSPRTPWRVL